CRRAPEAPRRRATLPSHSRMPARAGKRVDSPGLVGALPCFRDLHWRLASRWSSSSASDESLTQEQDEVRHAGVVTQLEQERAYLASVVGLMVEEVTHRPPERVLAALTGARPVCEGGGEPLGREPLREGFDGCVSPCPLPPQSGKVGVQ